MAERNHVPLAIEWMNDPSQCVVFLEGLIREFDSQYTRVETPPDESGESWLTVEKTKTYNGQRGGQLVKSIRLARMALSFCERKNQDVFRIEAQWEAAFQNLGQRLLNLGLIRVRDKQAVPNAEFALEEAFSSFESIVKDLKDWIRFSESDSNKAGTINVPVPSVTPDASNAGTDVESPKRSPYAEIEDALNGYQLKIFTFLSRQVHWTSFHELQQHRDFWRGSPDSSIVTDSRVFEALKTLREKLNAFGPDVSLTISKASKRTKLEVSSDLKARGKTGGK